MANIDILSRWFSLDGKVALVTGSGRGLGWGMAEALAEAGAHVVLNDLNADLLKEKESLLRSRGLKASTTQFDITDRAAVDESLAAIRQAVGDVDILINNAGFQNRKDFTDYSIDEVRKLMEVHYFGSVNMTQAVIPAMKAKKRGRIIFVGSLAVTSLIRHMGPYAGAKGALTALNRALTFELGPFGITCNVIAPGFFITEMSANLVNDVEFKSYVDRKIPLRRWAVPSELGPAVVFMASEAGAYYTGQVLEMNGGILTSV
jgi:gluconate 5-dehydrogenase